MIDGQEYLDWLQDAQDNALCPALAGVYTTRDTDDVLSYLASLAGEDEGIAMSILA